MFTTRYTDTGMFEIYEVHSLIGNSSTIINSPYIYWLSFCEPNYSLLTVRLTEINVIGDTDLDCWKAFWFREYINRQCSFLGTVAVKSFTNGKVVINYNV